MTALTPTSEPIVLTAGDTWAWTKTLEDYPAGLGWVLSYVLVLASATPTAISISSTASCDDHAVSVAAATTATYAAGTYHWTAMVTKGSERKTIGSGYLQVLPDPAATTHVDPRSHAEKCLAAVEAVLEGRMSDPIVKYQIGQRQAEKIPHGDLLKLRTHYRAEVRREQGKPRAIAIPVRFGHV